MEGIVAVIALLVTVVWFGIGYLLARWWGVLAMMFIGLFLVVLYGIKSEARWQAKEQEIEWRRAANKACEAEYHSLPAAVHASSVLDTTANLLSTELIQLLTERSLAFVEVEVAKEPDRAKAILMRDHSQPGPDWIKVEWARKPFVRLRLGRTSEAACRHDLTDQRWRLPPFLPDTCILADELDEPAAEIRIERKRAELSEPREYGWRRLVDVKSGQAIAQLTSAEGKSGSVHDGSDRLSRPGEHRQSVHCHKPQRLLVDLLRNPGGERSSQSKQMLLEVEVQPDVSPEQVLARASVWPRVESTPGESVDLSESRDFSYTALLGEWAAHVASAHLHPAGIGSHESRLLDLRAATLTSLKLADQERLRWNVHAALDGFFVTQYSVSSNAQLLIRFNRQGSLEWAVMIVDPSAKVDFSKARGIYRLSLAERQLELVYNNGDNIKLRVPLHQLPPIEGRPRLRH